MKVKIHTNNRPRPVIQAWELDARERAEFDYLDWEKIDTGEDSREFVRYKGQLYDLSEFMRVPGGFGPEMSQWDEYASDSYFSGILIRYPRGERGEPSWEEVIVGRYCS